MKKQGRYFRKIVHMNILDWNYFQKTNNTAYFKVEMRNKSCKITLFVDKIRELSNEIYKLCILNKDNGIYTIEPKKTIIPDRNNDIRLVINLEENELISFKGLAIVSKQEGKEIKYSKQIIAMGYYDEPISIQDIQFYNQSIENKFQNHQVEPIDEMKKVSNESHQDNNEDQNLEDQGIKYNDNNYSFNDEKNAHVNTLETLKRQLKEKNQMKIFEDIFEENMVIKPFDNTNNTEWVKIELTDIMFLPIEEWMLANNTFLINCYRKYKHLILGRDKKENILKLGIPDVYYFRNSVIANICGFNDFECCKDMQPKAGEYGYWIVETKL